MAILVFSALPVAIGFLLLAASNDSLDIGLEIAARLAFVPFGTVGAIIASRSPENPIGWLFCAAGLGFGL